MNIGYYTAGQAGGCDVKIAALTPLLKALSFIELTSIRRAVPKIKEDECQVGPLRAGCINNG